MAAAIQPLYAKVRLSLRSPKLRPFSGEVTFRGRGRDFRHSYSPIKHSMIPGWKQTNLHSRIITLENLVQVGVFHADK